MGVLFSLSLCLSLACVMRGILHLRVLSYIFNEMINSEKLLKYGIQYNAFASLSTTFSLPLYVFSR